MRPHRFNSHSGFTLIELLIVIAIVLILIAIALPNFLEARIRSQVTKVKGDDRSIMTAMYAYYTQWRKWLPDSHDLWEAGRPIGSWALISNKFEAPGIRLTTPNKFMTEVPYDPFVTQYEIGTAVPDDTGVSQQLGVYYLGTWSVNNYRPPGHERALGFLYSVGPSLSYSWNTPGYGNAYITEYSPTNGSKSPGGIWTSSNL
ncbi:MAG: hypothetical protein GHCLOJNM_02239 [bacterium]|nr:hypothetical protein [bacterium]